MRALVTTAGWPGRPGWPGRLCAVATAVALGGRDDPTGDQGHQDHRRHGDDDHRPGHVESSMSKYQPWLAPSGVPDFMTLSPLPRSAQNSPVGLQDCGLACGVAAGINMAGNLSIILGAGVTIACGPFQLFSLCINTNNVCAGEEPRAGVSAGEFLSLSPRHPQVCQHFCTPHTHVMHGQGWAWRIAPPSHSSDPPVAATVRRTPCQ